MTQTMSLTISCDDCTMRDSAACAECVVSYLCDPDDHCLSDDHCAVIVDAEEMRALRLLGRAGLTPPLRHRRRAAS